MQAARQLGRLEGYWAQNNVGSSRTQIVDTFYSAAYVEYYAEFMAASKTSLIFGRRTSTNEQEEATMEL